VDRAVTSLVTLARRHPSAVLLAVQLGGVLLYPLMEATPAGHALFGAFGLVVLGVALWLVRRSPALTWVGLLLALPVFVLSVKHAFWPDPELAVVISALEAVFYFYATGSLIAYVLQDQFATADELYAAGATFTLLAWAFAHVYTVCQFLLPESFASFADPHGTRTWMELLFLSFTTLSSVGLGDIVPIQPMSRALVMLEEFAGVMFIALVLARLIGLANTPQRRREG
jgi:hypothetical protein